jgi:phospholipid-binding lipoprotein MlaA
MSISNSQSQLSRKPTLLELPVRLKPSPRGLVLAIFLFLIALDSATAAESDPLENINRATHEFNQVVDRLLVKPLAETYQSLTPRFVRRGIGNFFANLNDVTVTVNDLLRLDLPAAGQSLSRVAVNSTVGLGGLVEVAYPAFGLEKTNQDFGLTLAHYGVEQGPYLVLPFFGPSTVRDAFGFAIDSLADPVNSVDHIATRNSLRGGQVLNYRASVLSFDDLVIGDDYLFYREAWLQRRAAAAGDPVMLGMSFDSEF